LETHAHSSALTHACRSPHRPDGDRCRRGPGRARLVRGHRRPDNRRPDNRRPDNGSNREHDHRNAGQYDCRERGRDGNHRINNDYARPHHRNRADVNCVHVGRADVNRHHPGADGGLDFARTNARRGRSPVRY
jgi:hypothetical protein